jgi:hypothetical protein
MQAKLLLKMFLQRGKRKGPKKCKKRGKKLILEHVGPFLLRMRR